MSVLQRRGLWRSATTFGRKLVTPKPLWHMLEVWPELQMQRHEAGDGVTWTGQYRGLTLGCSANLAEVNSAWAGPEPCYLVGSGPSMREQALHKLADGRVVLLNGALSLIDSHDIRPEAVVIVDYRFVRDRGQWLENIPAGTPCFFTPAVIRAVCDWQPDFFADKPWYVLENALRPYARPRRGWNQLGSGFVLDDPAAPQAAFSLDLPRGFVDARTVMYAACQLAVYAGARDINMVGFDIGNAQQPRFNETGQTRLKSRLDQAYPRRILPAMRLFARICRERGIACWNHSPVSLLPETVIPRSDRLNRSA